MQVVIEDPNTNEVVCKAMWENERLKRLCRSRIKFFHEEKLDGCLRVLFLGLMKFYVLDVEELFDDFVVDERAMVGCIYRYMYCAMRRSMGVVNYPDIDCEYNRMTIEYKRQVEKSMHPCERPNCCHAEKCYQLVENERRRLSKCKDKDGNECLFRPDIILHRRNAEHNGLIIEVKKATERDLRRVALDHAKVRYCTCGAGMFGYGLGATVLLDSNRATICLYRKGEDVKHLLLKKKAIAKPTTIIEDRK